MRNKKLNNPHELKKPKDKKEKHPLNVKMDPELFKQFKSKTAKNGLSITDFVVGRITEYLNN